MKKAYLLTILSEDKKGLVSIIMSMLNRKLIEIESISTSRTDIHNQLVITIEAIIEVTEVRFITLRINNIVEVLNVEACQLKDAWYQKIGIYILEMKGYNSEVFSKLQKYGAVVSGYQKNDIIIQKIGRDDDIRLLYNELEGPHLRNFSKSAAIALKPWDEEESSVISMAA
jgi:acetolactate synthase-1/3 small subunit